MAPPAAADPTEAPAAAALRRPAAPPAPLRSERLARLVDTAAAAVVLPDVVVDHERTLPPEALARVLAAVQASTAAATQAAYRSDWQRFARWAGRRRFPPLPAPPAVIAHYITDADPVGCQSSQKVAHFGLTI